MEPHERCWVRLPLDGANNVRELGGYPTANGGQTCYHRFLRSDGLMMLTKRDVKFLYNYGVRAVIDLRDPHEVEASPNVKLGKDVSCVNIPLMGFNAADIEELERRFDDEGFSMEPIYQHVLENYEGVRACMRFIAEAPQGCILFHCAVGKDRTGVLAMLLLSLAGVDKWDIMANYVQSRSNLMREESYREDWFDEKRAAFRAGLDSVPETIEATYDLMEEDHGGVESYLLECGVPDQVVAAVRRRLVQE